MSGLAYAAPAASAVSGLAVASATGTDVVHVTRATAAGVRRHVVDLMIGLADLGLRQALLYSPTGADDAFWAGLERLEARGIAAFPVQMARELSLSADLRAAREVHARLRRLRPAIVHLHSSKAGGVGRLAALFNPDVRVVYSPHASAGNVSRAYAAIELLLGRLRTDRVVAVSASEQEELARLRAVAGGRLARVDCGVSHLELHEAASEAASVALPDAPLVVACGRLCQQKDPEFLVRVSKQVVATHPAARFVWVGDGEMRPAVERAISEAGLDAWWTITGWLTNPFPVLRRATVFALPSRYESFGYVTLEAMLLGRPIVATRTTGTRDLVRSGTTGYLVDVGDADGFATSLRRILDDGAHADALGAAAAAVGGRFTRERMATEMLSVYASLH